MKRIILFLISAMFVFALTSCDEQGKKSNDPKKCYRKHEDRKCRRKNDDRQRRW